MSGTEALQTPAMTCASIPAVNGDFLLGDDMVILCFGEYNGHVQATYRGYPVYGHRNYEPINANEIWYCKLELNSRNGGNYFAIPFLKVDGNLLYSLSMEFRHDLARILLDHFPEEIRALIQTEVESGEDSGVHKDEMDATGNSVSESAVPDQPEVVHVDDVQVSQGQDANCISRPGSDTIRSELFADGWYDVCISRDHSVMRMRPRQQGGIRCKDHELCIYGLDALIPLKGSILRISSINEKTGIIKISVQ